MSTKIYNAFRFKGNLKELKKEVDIIEEKIINHCSKELEAFTKTTLFDCCWGVKDNLLKNFLEHIAIWKEEYTKDTVLGKLNSFDLQTLLKSIMETNINTDLNFKSQCIVIPYNKFLIVQFFSVPNHIMKEIEESNKYEDFHYQDQCDPYYKDSKLQLTKQEKIKYKRNYSLRRKIWDEIYKDTSTPSEVGFTFDFIKEKALNKITRSFFKKCETIDFKVLSNKKEISKVEDHVYSLANIDTHKFLNECYMGSLYNKDFNEELYIIYDDENNPLDETKQNILDFAGAQGIKITFVHQKDRELYRSPYERNRDAMNIGVIAGYVQRHLNGEK